MTPRARILSGIVACIVSFAVLPAVNTGMAQPGQFEGRLLVAAPDMPDPRFSGTVVLIARHRPSGTLGVVINRPIADVSVSRFLKEMLGEELAEQSSHRVRVQYGGPVEPSHGIYVHSRDYKGAETVSVAGRLSVTTSLDVLQAVSKGQGPKRGFLAMGYAGWVPGQLERELRENAWAVVPIDVDLVFDKNMGTKWQRAWSMRGINL